MRQERIPVIIFESNRSSAKKDFSDNVIPFPSKVTDDERDDEVTSSEWKIQHEDTVTSISIVSSGFGQSKETSSAKASMRLAA